MQTTIESFYDKYYFFSELCSWHDVAARAVQGPPLATWPGCVGCWDLVTLWPSEDGLDAWSCHVHSESNKCRGVSFLQMQPGQSKMTDPHGNTEGGYSGSLVWELTTSEPHHWGQTEPGTLITKILDLLHSFPFLSCFTYFLFPQTLDSKSVY